MANLLFIAGNAGAAFATVSWSGTASGSTTADGNGNYSILGLGAGSYTVTPSLSGFVFTPTNQVVVLTASGVVGINFTSVSGAASSVVDSRNYGNFPNKPVNIEGTQTYVVTSADSRVNVPVDSRVSKPVDSRVNEPVNSRT